MASLQFLLKRYWFPKQGNLLSFGFWISILGVGLSVALLIVVLGVMTGFTGLFQHYYTRISSDMVVVPRNRELHQEAFQHTISLVPGVEAVTPASLGQGMILKNGVGGVVLEGIDRKTSDAVTPWNEILLAPPRTDLEAKNSYWMWIGVQLAKKLGVSVGDTVDLLVTDGNHRKVLPFVITAIAKFGIYDHDMRYARIDIQVLNELFRRYSMEPFYKCKIKSGYSLDDVSLQVKKELGSFVSVKQWKDIHQNIFLAVTHQKKLLFLILQILIGLASLNVVNLLLMSHHQKRKDLAILKAMGMPVQSLFKFFVAQGLAVGLLGTTAGVVMGYFVCLLAEVWQPELLSESVYNVTRIPIAVSGADVFTVVIASVVVCLVFSVLPAVSAIKTKPIDVLRNES